ARRIEVAAETGRRVLGNRGAPARRAASPGRFRDYRYERSHRRTGLSATAGELFQRFDLRPIRWLADLWRLVEETLYPGRLLREKDSGRRQSWRPAGRAADSDRTVDQHEDRERTRGRYTDTTPIPRRQGDRIRPKRPR